MTADNPVFCALDTRDLAQARGWALQLAGAVGGLKLGLEFVTANGAAAVREFAAGPLPVFLDLKFHDIPNTVAGAVQSASALGVAYLTVHAAGGRAMLRAACDAAAMAARPPKVLAVTVLTSMDGDDLAETGVNAAPGDQVLRLARLAQESGCDGAICSPHEVAALRTATGPEFLLVVPGIRAAGPVSDQKRVMTAAAAMAAGADRLVIGRPITAAANPRAAALAIAAEIG
ncbi:MAG: orotidine-5'-phosphate decarboxylase [Proteobacteria bacterium]|nr:orotidine-5'-phosphate decarboxylase [Pseudomonadota bacterium]MDA1132311.1 orotidine-5'-phosphate decarboxylase [Pseudomonadota bacterium]